MDIVTVTSDTPAEQATEPAPVTPAPEPPAQTLDTSDEGAVPSEPTELGETPADDTDEQSGKDETPPWLKREVTTARNRQRAAEDQLRKVQEENSRLIETLTAKTPSRDEASPKPKRDEFFEPDDYDTALIDWAAGEATKRVEARLSTRDTEARQTQAQAQLQTSWQGKVAAAQKAHPDFAEIVYSDDFRCTAEMMEALVLDAEGAEIAYHLGMNTDEAARIAALSPRQQTLEIGKLSVKISTPRAKPTSKVPSPIKPLGSNENAARKSASEESEAEYFARRSTEVRANQEQLY